MLPSSGHTYKDGAGGGEREREMKKEEKTTEMHTKCIKYLQIFNNNNRSLALECPSSGEL